MKTTNYDILITKLDEFIRKYYKNRLLKGALYTLSLVLVSFLAVVFLEYFGHFGSVTRGILFYGLIALSLFILGKFVVDPLIRLFRLGKTISHDQASKIIGDHFPDVKDKLLNTLQLQKMVSEAGGEQAALIHASVDQRIQELEPVPFAAAIDFRENKKYLKYALPPLLLLFFILAIAPAVITDGTERIVQHTRYFEKEAPFRFHIQNDELEVIQQEDLQLKVKVEGTVLPDQAYIRVGTEKFRMDELNPSEFRYTFRKVNEPVSFRLMADGFSSREYKIKTLPKPTLLNFEIHLDHPDYIERQDETKKNTGDLVIPEGTKVEWRLKTKNTQEVMMSLGEETSNFSRLGGEDQFTFSHKFRKSKSYSITPANQFIKDQEPIEYHITVKPDRYPEIAVKEEEDSLSNKQLYFMGRIEDDHGFSRLTFNYRYTNVEGDSGRNVPKELVTQELPLERGGKGQEFFHSWSMGQMDISAGDQIQYFFRVWDNDGVNGPKSSRSNLLTYKAPTLDSLSEMEEKSNAEIKNDIKEGIKGAKELQEEIKDVQKDLLEKKQMDWQEKKKIRDLLQKQKELEKQVEDIKKQNQDKNREQSEFKKVDEEIMKKQEQLQKLMDQVMTEEMKKLFEELEKMMEEMDKEEMQKQMEKMNMSNEDIEKELDRSLEIFKQLEFEKKLKETIEKLDKLEKKQEKLSEKTENEGGDKDSLKKAQDDLNKDFEKVQEDLDSLQKKNEDLQMPNEMEDTESKEDAIKKDMKKSAQELQKGQKKDASDSQKKASEKMKSLSKQLQDMQMSMQSKSLQMNMEALRALLENLVQLSFDQEALMEELENTSKNAPEYVSIGQKQKKLRDDAEIIKDSLYALSKRVVQLEATINKEIEEIDRGMGQAVHHIAKRKTGQATSKQQYVMTALNELALLLDETLQSMQKQMASQKQGKSNCQKPGSGKKSKPGLKDLRKMQQKLSKQIQQMKKGENPGGKKPGGKKGQQMSKKIAKMAAQQEAIRRKIQEMSQKLEKGSKGQGDELQKIADEMEENEKDLVEKKFDREMMKRQKEIETRLLESEKAERKRKFEKKRKSEVAKNEKYSNPEAFFEYKRKKEQEVELLKTVPPMLKPYYKEKVNRYFDRAQQ